MASTSAQKNASWHEGEKCLAPNPKDGVLREATIHRLTTSSVNEDTAWVIFSHYKGDEEDEEEQEEKAIPISKLTRPGLNCFTQEKPVFPSIVLDPRLCVPLELNEVKEDRVPYTINRYLRDYQREGIRFMYNNYIRSKGCILGDDMGLGKTVQVIGFLAGALHKKGTWEDIENNRPQFLQSQTSKQSKPNKVFLIVAPLSVLYNWKDELDTWGHFQSVVVHGLRKEEELARINKGRIEIALTTYETLRLCLEQFNKIDWCAVFADEAHKIKNPNSQISQAMKELKCKIRIGLTGTILQNNLEELWCVMDWAIPGCLGSLGHFKTRFSDPIEQGQRHSATKRALATGRKTVRGLARRLSPWFLRRTKALIKDQLPKKDDRVVYCSLTDFQQTVYQAVLDTEDVTLILRSSEKCDCQSGRTRRSCCYKTNSKGVQIKSMYFSYLAILRKVANHVALLQSSSDTSKKQEMYVKDICTKVFQRFPDFVQRCKNEAFEALSDPMYSGKMKVLQKLLKHYLQKRDKVLIFSLSTKLLDVLESYCMAEGLDFSRLDGSTSAKQRVQIVKDFNSSTHVNLCLVSTMAGGLGLNFVGANVVVLFDPTWNPANDLQAIDRAYRIGQSRDVTVLRLISLGTVEEVIYLRQVYKQQLQSSVVGRESARRYFEAVQGHGIHKGELFGIKNLFRLQTQGTCLTRRILEREGQVEAGVMMTSTQSGEAKQQETKETSEPGVSSTCGPAQEEPAKEIKDGSEISKGVLDFSSGSEEEGEELGHRKMSSIVNDTISGGNATTSPGQTNLLQQSFSRLLERVKEKPDSGEEGLSSDAEESPFEGDGEDQMIDVASTDKFQCSKAKIRAADPQKLRTNASDAFCSSDRTHEERAGEISLLNVQEKHSLKQYVKEKYTTNLSDKKKDSILKTIVPKQHCFEAYSDESEDFDLESKTLSKKDVLNPPDRGGHRRNGKKRPSASARTKARAKYTEDIETFTSSEDEHTTVQHVQRAAANTPRRQTGRPKSVSFTSLKSLSSPASEEKSGNIDNVLEGVKEVAYIHSNQRVVGGSKAEEKISRAAVRDVFQRKMYSQLPANHLLGNEESLSESLLDSQPPPATVTLHSPTVDHPVTFTGKSVHHTKHTTFIIGETPKAICRKQLEEMAKKFKFSSVHQFAQEILNGSSAQRLTWLQDYYTSLNHPDLAQTVKSNFPQPDSTRTSFPSSAASSSSTTAAPEYPSDTRNPQKDGLKAPQKYSYGKTNPELKSKHKSLQNNVFIPQKKASRIPPNEGRKPPKKLKVSQKNVVEDLSDIPSPETEEESDFIAKGCNQTKRGSVSSPGAHKAGGGLGVDRSSSSSSSGLESREAAAFLNHTDRRIPSFSDLSHDRSSKASKATGEGQRETSQGPSTSSTNSFLTDLLGDISVLDDLLKPKPRSVEKRSDLNQSRNVPVSETTPSPSRRTFNPDTSSNTLTTQQVRTPERAAKGTRKDFWDILNEGNEESFNRLTDLKEVQRCITKNLAVRDRSPLQDNKSLWKTNEKFLWKK